MTTLKYKYVVMSILIFIFTTLLGCSHIRTTSGNTPHKQPISAEKYNASLPKDIYVDSGNRLPVVNRNELTEDKKSTYDGLVSPNTRTLAGIRGPGGIRLHGSGDLGESKVDRRTQELARLVVSREMDQGFEWTLHEPVALKFGLEPFIIDVIRNGKSLQGVPEREASIIQLGREIFQNHKVRPETFARVLKQIGKRDLIDICDYMGNYTKTAILLHAVNAHLPYDRESLLPVD
ncbi:MAG: carboxymuconolactone decarboxylase family protein [Gammaproteobacteria bacterium]|jgi:4-carboxymuconolactone decarboxylase